MNITDVLVAAPPTPACFPDRLQWATYLLQCEQYGKRESLRPFLAGVYRPAFNFCSDCTGRHADEMLVRDRCKPTQFRVIAIKAVPA